MFIVSFLLVLGSSCLSSKDVSSNGSSSTPLTTSYGIPLAEPLTSYGVPLAEPLNSYGIPLAEPLNSYGIPLAEPLNSYDDDLFSEASDNFDNKVTKSEIISDKKQNPSYGSSSGPLSTGYGVPLAGPLNSFDAAEYILDLHSEASDSIANKLKKSDITSDRNLKMLMASVPGVPGEDYPILADVLSAGDTGFSCQGKIVGGYYADPSPPSQCQIFHVCSSPPQSIFSFLCPNGTLFNQAYFICDWWFNVDCQQAEQLYAKNKEVDEEQERLAMASSKYQQVVEAVQEDTIYTAIAAANDKYGAPDDDIGSGDKDPVDPPYKAIPTGYGVPRGKPLNNYHPSQERERRKVKKTKSRNVRKVKNSSSFLNL